MRNILLFIFLLTSSLVQSQIFDFLPTSTTNKLIKHTYYTLSYSPKDKQAEWVAYMLTKQNLLNGEIVRTDNYRPDSLVTNGSATLADYYKSGYDRGHLVPAADMKMNFKAMTECFFLSNMSPQKAEFNRGIWEKLEKQVRGFAKEYDTIYIVTGGILKYPLGSIGEGKVTVPKYFYKVLLDYTKPNIKAIAFILPNEKGTKQLYEYAIKIDSLESLTEIDFFSFLPDSIENRIESNVDISKWKFDIVVDTSKTSPPKQCKGITNEGNRCKTISQNENGYCDNHQNQIGKVDMTVIKENRSTVAIKCSAITQKGTQCSRKTYSPNGKCWQHGGD